MNIKRTEVGFNEDYVRKVAKKERTNMLRIMRKKKQSQKELGIWTRDDAGNLIRNDEITKEAVVDPSKTTAFCPFCKEDNEVDTVRGGIYGSGLGKSQHRCVVCGRQFEMGSTKKAQLSKERIEKLKEDAYNYYSSCGISPTQEEIESDVASGIEDDTGRDLSGEEFKELQKIMRTSQINRQLKTPLRYKDRPNYRPDGGGTVKRREDTENGERTHCMNCSRDFGLNNDGNCPFCGSLNISKVTPTKKARMFLKKIAQRTIGPKWKNEIKKLVNKAKSEGMTGAYEISEYVKDALPQEAFDTWESAHDEIERITNDLVMSRSSQIETDEITGAGDETHTISTATINLTSRGDQNLVMARENKLPYDMMSTEISEEFWTLVTEELDTIHNHPDITDIQWYKGEGLSPTYSEVYSFFLKSLDPLDLLSDNKTKVNDISGMLWLEAFSTMHDNNMIEVVVDDGA